MFFKKQEKNKMADLFTGVQSRMYEEETSNTTIGRTEMANPFNFCVYQEKLLQKTATFMRFVLHTFLFPCCLQLTSKSLK
jgi:hypothetical protein